MKRINTSVVSKQLIWERNVPCHLMIKVLIEKDYVTMSKDQAIRATWIFDNVLLIGIKATEMIPSQVYLYSGFPLK